MSAYGFPSTTEVNTVKTTTISTSSNNGYNFINSEKPVPSSKLRGILKAFKDIIAFVEADDEALITPTLLNSWTNFGSGFQTVKYYKDKSNCVHVFGMVANGNNALATPILQLPAGYRPSADFPFHGSGYFGSGSNDQPCGFRMLTTGNLTLNTAGAQWACFNLIFRV